MPHFYYNFYVYKYAIGQICANFFFSQYQQHGPKVLQSYTDNFLRAGGRDWPLKILKASGIDLFDQKIYDHAFGVIDNHVSEWIKLGKQIFKV
ncbi:M3 family metallopeptidase [Mycoplasma sp. ATU-Cv-508]|uniref:M3 family metallopeptidase n=1 Tax=Mycoplasma sp. ATU-Cv-508 TaxID=2048001 RepID=UPI000FDEEB74